MAAGGLDRRIVIERATVTHNALNEQVEAWDTYASVWAKKTDVSDGERNAAGQVGAFLVSRFVIRSSTTTRAIKPSDRIRFQGLWSIQGVKETQRGRNRFLEITAVKDAD